MGLKKWTKIVQAKNADTQYVTIPASIVHDSQYPFKDGGTVEITIDPIQKIMILSRGHIEIIRPEGSHVEVEPGSFLVKVGKMNASEDLKAIFLVEKKAIETIKEK